MTENHGVPGSNPGPATQKTIHLQGKRARTWAAPLPAPGTSTTTSFAEGVGGRPMRGQDRGGSALTPSIVDPACVARPDDGEEATRGGRAARGPWASARGGGCLDDGCRQ